MKIIKTEQTQLGKFSAVVYHLQTDKQGYVGVSHLPALKAKGAIVMLPGMFSNRKFWLSDKGVGFAGYLVDAGYECWIVDRRGLGVAKEAESQYQSLFNALEIDLPAVQSLLKNQGTDKAFYMGHSFGGVLNGIAVAKGYLNSEGVAGLINFSSQLTVGKTLLNKPYSALIYAITGIMGYFPSARLKMGPENESKAVMRDSCKLVDWAKGSNKASFWSGFNEIQCPVLAFGSLGDTVDPHQGCQDFIAPMGSAHKQFVLLGKKFGNRRDYDHVGMLVSKDAQQEVWPMVTDWLEGQNKRLQKVFDGAVIN